MAKERPHIATNTNNSPVISSSTNHVDRFYSQPSTLSQKHINFLQKVYDDPPLLDVNLDQKMKAVAFPFLYKEPNLPQNSRKWFDVIDVRKIAIMRYDGFC